MKHLLPLFLLSLLCTCAPAPEKSGPPSLPFDYEYALIPGALDSSKLEPYLNKFRLELTADSALFRNPIRYETLRVPAYAATDTAGGVTDSMYFVYAATGDGSLEGELVLPRQRSRERFRPVPKEELRPWTEKMVDRAYLMRADSANYLVYLDQRFPRPNGGFLEGYLLRLSADGTRHVTNRSQGFGEMVDGDVTVVFRALSDQHDAAIPYPAGRPVLLTLRDASDRPLLALVDPNRPETLVTDTFRLSPYPSPLPEGLTAADLLPHLALSRIEVGPVPPEPDSVGIEYLDPEPNRPDPVMQYAELPTLDIAFDEDGKFTYFAGDRTVTGGGWRLSEDGNFLIMNPAGYHRGGPMLIEGYNEKELRVPVPLNVQTRRPRGVRIRSYFRPQVPVSFIRE